jgi:hypothetical protein
MKQILFLVCAMLIARGAAAQGTTKIFVAVNGAYQLTANDFSDGATRRENAEDGRLDTTYGVKAGPAIDAAGGARVWRNLGVGVGVTRFTVATPTTLTGTVPHPFFFNRLRPVSGEATGLTREELAIHIQVRGVFPVSPRIQVMVFVGPSFFRVKQGVVTDFTYRDSYPYDEATFGSAVTSAASVSKMGFGGGGDVAFFFTRQVGVGGTLQFAGTTVEVPAVGDAMREIKVGGAKAGGGLRLRF